jgi:hypothetical protein
VISLALNQLPDEPLFQVEWCDHQFFQSGVTGQTGERVEHCRDLFG